MTNQHIIKVLVLILLFITLNCKGIGISGVADANSIKNMNNFEETKHHIAQKRQRQENSSKSAVANSCTKDKIHVSIIQLISNPEKFDGKCVRLIGFVQLEFEGDAIYLHKDDYENRLTKNGLWLDLNKDFQGKDNQKYAQKYVLVEGTFSANNEGHMNLFSGAIENINRFEVWPVKNGRVIPGSSLDR